MSNFRVPVLNDAGEFTGSALTHIQTVARAAAAGSGAGAGGGSDAARDTGWRRVGSPNLASGSVFFRRVGNIVMATVRGGSWDTATVKPAGSRAGVGQPWGDLSHRARLAINILPGFRSPTPAIASVLTDDGEAVGMLIMSPPSDGNRLSFRGFRNGTIQDVSNISLRFPLLMWFTDDKWPTELPGEAA